jgi:hypothetical protein
MNFQATFSGSPSVIKIINAPSWSSCLAYCEGTGLGIVGINIWGATIVINDETSTNCFLVTLLSEGTRVTTNYMVFDTDYNILQTWINAQTGKTVMGITLSEKSYVVV